MSEILDSLHRRFPLGAPFHDYMERLAADFATSGCADANFLTEFASEDIGQFWSCAWEAILFNRFSSLGWSVSRSPAGPDFRLETTIGPVLVEAVVPRPEGLPDAWLAEHDGVYNMPHEAMLLRWTASIDAKQKKHLKDIELKRVTQEPFVIAVNSCMLSRYPEDIGISQWPFAAEAVFAIGPLAVNMDRRTGDVGQAYQTVRLSIKNRNNSDIPTSFFLSKESAHVSAILGCATCKPDQRTRENFGGGPPMILVHNPLAAQKLPLGWLPQSVEYQAVPSGDDEFVLSRITK